MGVVNVTVARHCQTAHHKTCHRQNGNTVPSPAGKRRKVRLPWRAGGRGDLNSHPFFRKTFESKSRIPVSSCTMKCVFFAGPGDAPPLLCYSVTSKHAMCGDRSL